MTGETQDKKIYHVSRMSFTEIQPGVTAPVSFERAQLTVPAQFSKTGHDEEVQFAPGTLILNTSEANNTEYLKKSDLDLMGQFAKVSGKEFAELMEKTRGQRNFMYDFEGKNEGAVIVLDRGVDSGALDTIVGWRIESDYLKNPELYYQAFQAMAADHEAHHIDHHAREASVKSEGDSLIEETRADQLSLKEHFNKEFKDVAMDMRAIEAFKSYNSDGAHATHIWAEEFEQGIELSQKEADIIAQTPKKINDRMIEIVGDREGLSMEELDSSPETKYAVLKTLNEKHVFDDIPYAREFIDKYTKAVERQFKPEILESVDLNEYREAFSDIGPNTGKSADPGLKPNVPKTPAPVPGAP